MLNSTILYFDKTADKFPAKTAVDDDADRYSFDELRNLSKSIGSAIIEKRRLSFGSVPIGVYMPRSSKSIASFFGVLYSGNYYVPIDEKMPSSRLAKLLDNLKPAYIITIEKHAGTLREAGCGDDKILIYEQLIAHEIESGKINAVLEKVIDTDPIYVVYTSGSTGVPKGVVIPHKGVIDYAMWLEETFQIDDTYILGNQAPFYFDNSILDIYLMALTGCTMFIIPDILFMFPVKLPEYVNSKEITLIFWVPTVLINVANSGVLDGFRFDHLKKVLFCGEAMPNKQLNIWRRHNPHLFYANLYGPSEITDVCTYYIVDREFKDSDPLPIGRACKNMRALIFNDDDKIAKPNEIGELCILGTGLSLGYYASGEITKKAFVQNPANDKYMEIMYRTGDLSYVDDDGLIIFVGRKDSQIKHNGNRIEMGEIETAAKSIDAVGNACVLFNQSKNEIVLFVETQQELESKAVLKQLNTMLPSYMVPSAVKQMEKIPLNANGKIDRVLLKSTYLED